MYTLGGILRFYLMEVKMTRRASSVVLRDQEQLEEIFKRVKRAEGQIAGVIRMLEDGRNCEEIVHQMAAVGKAMNTAAITLISSSLEECMSEKKNNQAQRERLLKLFMSLA
jgi:DNA-binding FrmR family transcriptional regulator